MKTNTIEQAVQQLQQGHIILVVDDEDRENEGDLIGASSLATTEMLNFMATHAKGLICMPLSSEMAARLSLDPMTQNNTDNHETAFTVSIDYQAATTGISAEERALTARMASSVNANASMFRRPGHLFPLIAKPHGVLERNGHTEATVDLMRLAGLPACGLCCEIMDDDGTMMRQQKLEAFAARHHLTTITITELQDYQRNHIAYVHRSSVVNLPTRYGDFKMHCYINTISGEHHLALVKGTCTKETPTLCRIHSECLTGDVFGSLRCDCGAQLDAAMKKIAAQKNGVLLYMRQEGRGIGLVNKLKAYHLQEKGMDTLDANLALGFPGDMREYGTCAQILKDLGISEVLLMTNNPDKINELNRYHIHVVKRVPLEIAPNSYDRFYLSTKKNRMHHLLTF